MCVLRGFCGNEVGEGGTQDSGGAREPWWEDVNGSTSLRWDGFEVINLIRESMAAPELQCIITISTLVFAKCHLYLSSPVSLRWTMSLLRQQLLIHSVTIIISHVFPDYTSADVIQSSSLPCPHTLSHTHTQTFSSIWYICHLVWKTGCCYLFSNAYVLSSQPDGMSLECRDWDSHILALVSRLMSPTIAQWLNGWGRILIKDPGCGGQWFCQGARPLWAMKSF